MSTDLDKRVWSVPYQRHSDTSMEAAVRYEPKAGTDESRVLQDLREQGLVGRTDEEQQNALRMSPNTQRPRRVGLVDKGLVKDSGRKRQTRSGGKAVVWVAS